MPSPEVRAQIAAKAKQHVQTLCERFQRSESAGINRITAALLQVFVISRKSLMHSICKINSSILHLVFELIQNADDVEYPPGVMPELRIDLARPGYILFECNQCGFMKGNVEALCSIDESSKKGNVNTTGEKGLGFKSIFKVCKTAWIYSNGYSFSLERDGLGMVTPIWTEPCNLPFTDLADPFERTHIILEFATGEDGKLSQKQIRKLYEDIYQLKPEMLLFLRRLRAISITAPQHTRRRIWREAVGEGEVDQDVSKIKEQVEVGAGAQRTVQSSAVVFYVVHDYMVDMPEATQRPGCTKSRLTLAFPFVQETSKQNVRTRQPRLDIKCDVFAFLPLRSTNFYFHINADWVTAVNRENIEQDHEWNVIFRDAIGKCFLDSGRRFLQDPLFRFNWLRWIPRGDVPKANASWKANVTSFDDFFESAALDILTLLHDSKVIVDSDERLRRPGSCMTIRSEYKHGAESLVPPSGSAAHFAHSRYSPEDHGHVLRRVGCKAFGKTEFVEASKNMGDEEFRDKLQQFGPRYFTAFYRALKTIPGWTAKQLARFQELRCVPVMSYQIQGSDRIASEVVLARPTSSSVFLATHQDELQGQFEALDPALRFVSRTVCGSSDVEDFLCVKLLIKRADIPSISRFVLDQHSLPAFQRDISVTKRHLQFFIAYADEHDIKDFSSLVLLDEENARVPLRTLYYDSKDLLQRIDTGGLIKLLHPTLRKSKLIQFLLQHGLALFPRVSEARLSPELDAAINRQGNGLTLLALLVQVTEGDPSKLPKHFASEAFISAMKRLQVPCTDGFVRPLEDTFFRTRALAIENDLPFIQIATEQAKQYKKILMRFGVSFSANLEHCLKILEAASSNGMTDLAAIKVLYRKVDAECTVEQAPFLRESFMTKQLLYLPHDQSWHQLDSKDIFWSTSLSYPLDKFGMTLLHACYSEHESLFRRKLGVENFSIQHAATFLKALLLVDGVFRDLTPVNEEILNHVLDDLSRFQRDDPLSSKPWLQEILELPIFVLRSPSQGRIVNCINSGGLLVPDDSDAARALLNDDRIKLLNLSDTARPLRSYLIEFFNHHFLDQDRKIYMLSDVLVKSCWYTGHPGVNLAQTRDIKRHRREIIRFIYSQEHRDPLVCADKLLQTEVKMVEAVHEILEIATPDGTVSVPGIDQYCMHQHDAETGKFTIMISNTARDDLDEIKNDDNFFRTLQLFLGCSDRLREFLKDIWRKDPQKIERYLMSKSIGELPAELTVKFDNQDEIDGGGMPEEQDQEIPPPPEPREVKDEGASTPRNYADDDDSDLEIVDSLPPMSCTPRKRLASTFLGGASDDEEGLARVPHLEYRTQSSPTPVARTSSPAQLSQSEASTPRASPQRTVPLFNADHDPDETQQSASQMHMDDLFPHIVDEQVEVDSILHPPQLDETLPSPTKRPRLGPLLQDPDWALEQSMSKFRTNIEKLQNVPEDTQNRIEVIERANRVLEDYIAAKQLEMP